MEMKTVIFGYDKKQVDERVGMLKGVIDQQKKDIEFLKEELSREEPSK